MTNEGPHLIDVYVGAKVRLRRKSLGLSQSALSDALGITFQQVQKYRTRRQSDFLFDAVQNRPKIECADTVLFRRYRRSTE